MTEKKEEGDKITAIPEGKNKSPVEAAATQLKEQERKKHVEAIKKQTEIVVNAKNILVNEVTKLQEMESSLTEFEADKFNFKELVKVLGL